MSSSLYAELRELKRHKLSVYNRLCSIQHDAEFIRDVSDAFPKYAVVANLRCGTWYVRDSHHTVYFKSTDGHTGTWDFSIRRLNLHLIQLIAQNGGCIIVDSSRRKRMPDSFARTIPIWAACLNRAVRKYKESHSGRTWDEELYTPNNIVSRSEHSQIEAKLPVLVEKLEASGVDLEGIANILQKPLRPFWYGPEFRPFLHDPPNFEAADFSPLLLVNASEVCANDGIEARHGYMYIQGAADDEDTWSHGLTSELYWAHEAELRDCSSDLELEEAIASVLHASKPSMQLRKGSACGQIGWSLGDSGITICSRAQLQEEGALPANSALIILDSEPVEVEGIADSGMLWVKTEGQKKDAHIFETSMVDILEFAGQHLDAKRQVNICCRTGTDISVAAALAVRLKRHSEQSVSSSLFR